MSGFSDKQRTCVDETYCGPRTWSPAVVVGTQTLGRGVTRSSTPGSSTTDYLTYTCPRREPSLRIAERALVPARVGLRPPDRSFVT